MTSRSDVDAGHGAPPAARVAEPNSELIAVAREHATRLAPLLA